MKEPIWLDEEIILSIHEELLALFGGGSGVRDQNKLLSALDRPLNLFHYENPDLYELAATYADGIVKGHPFMDGNKRTGFMATYTFLGINGYQLTAPEEQAVLIILDLAQAQIGVPELALWLRDNTQSLEK